MPLYNFLKEVMVDESIDKTQKISTWDNYDITFKSYQTYLEQKVKAGRSRYELDFTDLLYASNYKGGSGSIQEDFSKEESRVKLNFYSDLLKEIYESFSQLSLEKLKEDELKKLMEYARRMIELCSTNHIKGLGVSYCSALFHLHFPNLIPVIDRNVLLGLSVIKLEILQKSGQIWKIEKHYIHLVEKMYSFLVKNGNSLRLADKELFDKGKEAYETYQQRANP